MSGHHRRETVDPDEVLNKIYQGQVAGVHNYGAFVQLPGFNRVQGLVHKSQISTSMVPDATEVLDKGDTVWFKVVGVSDDGKIALSMKVVDQGSGADLDPNGVQMHLDEQQRKSGNFRSESKAIELEAVYKTTCAKCGVKGHMSKDCFRSTDGKVYDLIPEPEKEAKIFGSEQDRLKRLADCGVTEEVPTKKVKKEKKEKKKKKKRRRSDTSGSDSSGEDRKKQKKSKEKKKKKKKRKKSP